MQFVLAIGLVEKPGQLAHSAAPSTDVNVLAAQSDGVVVAIGQKSPAGHARQEVELGCPVLGLYVPATQLVGSMDLMGQ